jgi:hypothetical protein
MMSLASMPYDHKLAVAVALDYFIKKDKAEQEVSTREFGVADELVEVINGDGGAPIARKYGGGRKPNPNSKMQRMHRAILQALEDRRGKSVPRLVVRNAIIQENPDFDKSMFYVICNKLIKEGKITKSDADDLALVKSK